MVEDIELTVSCLSEKDKTSFIFYEQSDGFTYRFGFFLWSCCALNTVFCMTQIPENPETHFDSQKRRNFNKKLFFETKVSQSVQFTGTKLLKLQFPESGFIKQITEGFQPSFLKTDQNTVRLAHSKTQMFGSSFGVTPYN